MALDKISINTKYSPSTNIKISAIMAAMGRAKMYELLHKQIWRKTRDRVDTYTLPGLSMYKGRPVAFVSRWNIKSESKQPYNYVLDRADHPNYGLNQLFKGEGYSPYVHYGTVNEIYWDVKYTISGVEHYLQVYMYYYNTDKKKFTKLADSVSIENINGKIYKRMHLGANYTDELLTTLLPNQVFSGYEIVEFHTGDPGSDSGIYHDDCYITPKMMPVSAEHDYYVYTHNDYGEYGITETKYFRERDDNGTVVIDSVELENYIITVAGKPRDRCRLIVNYTSGAVDRIDLGDGDYSTGNKIEKRKSHEVLGHAEEYKIEYDLSRHGAVIWEQVIDMPYQFTTTSSQKTTKEDGWIRQYSDGTVIQYRPLEVEYWGDGMDNTIPGHYKILPMVYTDTGDLTMPVADFVNNWGDYFELVVHEDSEWWESLLAPVIAIIIIVLSVITAGTAAVVLAGMSEAVLIGGIISAVGVLSGNKTISLVGSVISLGATAYANMAGTAAAQKIGVEAAKTASAETMATTIGGLSASEVFAALPNIGLGNLVTIGAKIVSIGMSIDSIMEGEPDVDQVDATEPVDASVISFTTTLGKDDSEYDVFGQIGKQFEMY